MKITRVVNILFESDDDDDDVDLNNGDLSNDFSAENEIIITDSPETWSDNEFDTAPTFNLRRQAAIRRN